MSWSLVALLLIYYEIQKEQNAFQKSVYTHAHTHTHIHTHIYTNTHFLKQKSI